MTVWYDVKLKPAPEKDLLVFGTCGLPHIAIWSYGAHCHTEACLEGTHFTGNNIEFTHWADLPKAPHD